MNTDTFLIIKGTRFKDLRTEKRATPLGGSVHLVPEVVFKRALAAANGVIKQGCTGSSHQKKIGISDAPK